MRKYLVFIACAAMFLGCNKPSKVDQYHAEKHERDSIALGEQERSLAFYEAQLDSLQPEADSLIALFKYERDEKYQDHGYYVVTGPDGLRVMVRDDGMPPILLYRYGNKVDGEKLKPGSKEWEAYDRAQHLSVVMSDIKELEKRIQRTSLEVQKYQKRLQKQ